MSFEYSDSSYNPLIIANQDGVRILDPNPVQEIVPPEDMFIYISLEARQRSKSVLTQVDDGFYNFDTKKLNTIDIAVPQEETFAGSKLFRSKPMLTTEWTEIGGHNVDLFRDYEGFGITNIDVKIQSQSAPQVVIDFIDVRGATLFEQGSCSPYGLFFKLPYPIFILTLKGYYGRPVQYYLNLVKFNSKFNSETGNMDCRAEFIGYSFAFLSDVIMGYVGASQYLKEETYKPQGILREKYVNTVKRDGNDLQNFCDNPVITEGRCYTINDLLRVVNDFDKYTQPQIVNSPEFNELQNLTALKNSYDTYAEHVNELIRELEKNCGAGVTTKVDFGDNSSRPIRFEIKTDEIFKKLIAKDGTLTKYFANKSGILSADIKLTKTKEIKPGEKADNIVKMLTTAGADQFSSTDPNNQCPGCADLYNLLEKEPWNNIFNLPESIAAGISFKMNSTPTGTTKFIDMGYIVKDIEAERNLLSGENFGDSKKDGIVTEKRKKLIEDINKLVKQNLGFDPTIRNIFTILLCNTDAFMQILVNVAVQAEKYHDQRASEYSKLTTKAGDGNTGLISGSANMAAANGNPKVYPWPTYYRRSYKGVGNGASNSNKNQGTKEAYPGDDNRFLNWIEVRFVEDFIDAYLEYNRDRKIINGEKEGIAGFDNYVPINPLESPALSQDTPIKYLDLNNVQEIYPVIGERLFIALDHSTFSPIRLTIDAYLQPRIGNGEWNPIKNNDPSNLSVSVGTIEAHNILNCQDSEAGRTVLATIINENNKQEFIDNVVKSLKDTYGENSLQIVKADTLKKLQNTNAAEIGFDPSDEYYVFDPGPDGILLSHKTKSRNRKTYIKSNPFDMENKAATYPAIGSLLTIVNAADVNDTFAIKLVPEDGPMSQAVASYTSRITELTAKVKFGTSEFDPKTTTELDKAQKIPMWSDPTLFTTLAMVSEEEPNGTSWFTQKNLEQLSQSNMGLLCYWDYSDSDGTYGISLFAPNGGYEPLFTNNEYFVDIGGLEDVNLADDIKRGAEDGDGASTSFITTPLWLDNVRKFRNNVPLKTPTNFYIYNQKVSYTEEELEYRNLAYLFLQTLKTTPPIIRYVDDDGEFFAKGDDETSSFIYSLKAFNTAAGVAKVPKAWLLTLGAILWRWKMFVGTKVVSDKRVWNKPLTCEGCSNGDMPTGFDPIAQPGWNSYDNGTVSRYDRNRADEYLDRIYGSKNWYTQIQTSSFRSLNTLSRGQDLTGGFETVKAYFPYFNLYKDKLGFSFSNRLTPISNTIIKNDYSWPMLWIAPHHIPYVHPERFFDDETDSTAFVQLFDNSLGYIDYITFMNAKREKNSGADVGYYESPDDNEQEYTYRSKKNDGNLGMVLQYIPDDVKDEIVKYFDNWCLESWPNLLGVVDPIHFGAGNATLSSTYTWDNKIAYTILGNSSDSVTLVPKTEGTDGLKKLMTDQVLLYNSTPKIWYGITSTLEGPSTASSDFYGEGFEKLSQAFLVSKINFDNYLGALYDEFVKNRDAKSEEINKKTTEEENELAGSLIEDSDIKLALYRTFKSLTDKWISSTPEGKSFFNVIENGKGCAGNDSGPKTLSAHFQYVNRVMGDIGNIAMINVSKLRELNDNIKISLYQYLSDILTDNEYMFFPLPGYVDFTSQGMSDNDLKDMFRPVLSLKRLSCGPVFLCMYVGGNSRQLKYKGYANCPEDLKELEQLEDDSFWVSNIAHGGAGLPDEIVKPLDTGAGAGYTAFKIVYGQENQNHFKNIQLDQSEFSETAESLLVIDKLSQQGGTDRTSKGQNLNSVYLTRSYSCQVESLGNMMIQPMTYFDLIGVPMFNGAYLITTVEHNFKPNHATTRFKGVRQPRATVPVVTDAAIAMNMSFKDMKSDGSGQSISSLITNSPGGATNSTSGAGGGNTSATNTGGGSGPLPKGNYAPIIVTLIENGATNGNVLAGNNTLKPIPAIIGINNEKLSNKAENNLITEATDSLVVMMNDWVAWMKSEGFKGSKDNKNVYGGITSVFRDYNKQVQIKKEYGDTAATPGTSNHGWAIAVDIQMFTKEGDVIRNIKNTPKNYNLDYNPSLKWLLDNSYSYGWVLPANLRDQNGLEEHWHFEYHGTAASCLMTKNPTTYGYTVTVNKPNKPSVVNPKTKEGQRAVYVNCDYKTPANTGDGTPSNTPAPSDNRCTTAYPNLPWVEYKTTYLLYKEAKDYLSKTTDEATAKSVFAVLWAEAGKSKDKPGFVSAGNNNYAGVQSDGNWGDKERTGTENKYPYFSSQYCRKDSGNQYRAFASFETNEKFLDFMIDRIKKKGFNSSNADGWTHTYVQSWWSPGLNDKNGGVPAKSKIYKDSTQTWVDFHDQTKIGGDTFNNKKSIFNTAIGKWDSLA